MSRRILIAGVGNIFLGDDAFGLEVVRKLVDGPLPPGVTVRDFGIRGFDLACAIVDGYDAVVLVDATFRGGEPGTLFVIELDANATAARDRQSPALDGHTMNLDDVLEWVRTLGSPIPTLRLVGCEPAVLGDLENPWVGLSPQVARAAIDAQQLIESLVHELLYESAPKQASGISSS